MTSEGACKDVQHGTPCKMMLVRWLAIAVSLVSYAITQHEPELTAVSSAYPAWEVFCVCFSDI